MTAKRHGATTCSRLTAWRGWSDRRVLVALLLTVWVVYLATATYTGAQINDNRATNVAGWRLVSDGTLAVPGAWVDDVMWARPGVDGHHYVDRFPGTIAHGVPFHAVATAAGVNADPVHPAFLNYVAGGVAAATVAAAFIGVLYLVFRHLVDRPLALAGALVAAFGTATWSISADSLWTHGPTSLWLTVGMLLTARQAHARAGLAFAVAVLARPQTAVAPAIVGIWRAIARRDLRPVVAIGATSILGVLALSAYSRLLFGTWIPVAGYPTHRAADVVTTGGASLAGDVWRTLFDGERGVLVYTPFVALLLPFLHRGWRVAPDWVRASAVAGIVYMIVQLRANAWDGGAHFFGSRLTIEMLVLAAPLLLLTVREGFRRYAFRWFVLQLAAVAAIGIHAVGATTLSMSEEGHLMYNQFVREACAQHEDHPDCS